MAQNVRLLTTYQVINAVEEMRANILGCKTAIAEAKGRQETAAHDVKTIEKDMDEFSNNKDSKLAELQKSLEKLKKSLVKDSAAIKPLQQEARDAKLDAEQCGGDLATAKESLEEIDSTLQAQQEEVVALQAEQNRTKVSRL